jgi:SnoaL-like domain
VRPTAKPPSTLLAVPSPSTPNSTRPGTPAASAAASGESYAIAHHLFSEEGNRKIMIASLRYLDTFAKIDGSWYFAHRNLVLDWSETRPSTPVT